VNNATPIDRSPPCGTDSRTASLINAFRESGLETPSYVFDHDRFHENGRLLREIQDRTGVKILLAQKAFSSHALYPTIRRYLAGTTSSGLHEALLGHEYFGGEVHVFSPAFKEREMDRLLEIADHLVFNSLNQWMTFRDRVSAFPRAISVGLRINPEYSSASTMLYDPCAPGSRFGIRAETLSGVDLNGIDGLHFHVSCEQYEDALEGALKSVEERFAKWLPQMKWLNMGGGHLLTSPKYDLDRLYRLLGDFSQRYPHLALDPRAGRGGRL